ncbi:MAG: HAD family hydrolase [Pseudomonadales bacterium]
MADIRLITFDLDNTLWDVGTVIRHAESTMNDWLDERVPEYRKTLDREAVLGLREAVIRERPELGHDVSALREEILFRGMRRLGHAETQAREHAAGAFQAFLEARQQVVFFEAALESLAELAARYRLAALTNGNADVGRIGLDRYFSFALCAADVRASKPAPDIFHAALETAGVRPEESIHVGDNPVDDVHGASAVGMHTIWVRHEPSADARTDEPAARPTAVVGHLRDLPGAVRRIHFG